MPSPWGGVAVISSLCTFHFLRWCANVPRTVGTGKEQVAYQVTQFVLMQSGYLVLKEPGARLRASYFLPFVVSAGRSWKVRWTPPDGAAVRASILLGVPDMLIALDAISMGRRSAT